MNSDTDGLRKNFSGVKYEKEYFARRLHEIRSSNPDLKIYCVNSVPKSGSTYTLRVIKNGVGGRVEHGGDLENEVEQDFTISGIERTLKGQGPVIYKNHSLANFVNLRAFEHLQVKYINIVRSIYDAMVSVDEHLLRTLNKNNVALWPGVRAVGYGTWDTEKRMDFVSIFIMPWYFKFMGGWYSADRSSIFYYEDLVSNKEQYFAAVARRLELGAALDHEAVKVTDNVRFNVGKVGRGEVWRKRYEGTMRRYSEFYPAFDYRKVGL